MTKLTFSTNEVVSLERKIDSTDDIIPTEIEDLEYVYEISRCAEWIRSNQFQKVCLQFPDHLLPDSSEVTLKLQNVLGQTIYILGDTAYESCCVDYIAAAHINADAIIHYGPVCFSKSSGKIPYLNIYEKHQLNVDEVKNQICDKLGTFMEEIIILVDTPYLHLSGDLVSVFMDFNRISVKRIDETHSISNGELIVFLCRNKQKLINVQLTFPTIKLFYYDGNSLKMYDAHSRVLMKRNFLTEKIKDSQTIGIVIGTLGVQNYLEVIERLKNLITLSGKKYYLISVGKPTVAKLANFPELDVYVMVTCSMNEIYESRDFYKPIATPFDIEIAFNTNNTENIQFSYEFNGVLDRKLEPLNVQITSRQEDVSLLTNKIRSNVGDTTFVSSEGGTQIALKSDGTLALNTSHGAGYLADRSWKGLEQNLGQTEVELAQEGRSGIAQKYKDEPT
ncbi:unnamed protein product [Phaedon cochleariae]|uniref:2-(3-amino-3-carboxypropyl)histidine synthase n=1 Tax=Phaedon cochleariae TaxID=80249 RepID=A0A9P0GT32_PHACE|nr:unnamed protein product [Phaedon cochleariae]